MILARFLQQIRPFSLYQTKLIRPSMKIGKEKFELYIDVHTFNRDEIRVKVRPEFLVIEGKQEYEDKYVFKTRQFVRKFKLPPGTDVKKLTSTLSVSGVLTVSAPRTSCDLNMPCERLVSVQNESVEREVDISLINPNDVKLKPHSQTPGQQT